MGSKTAVPLSARVGERIRALRQARSLTLEAVGDRAGFSGKYIGEIERGLRDPSVSTLEAIVERGLGAGLFEVFVGLSDRPSVAEQALGGLVRLPAPLQASIAALVMTFGETLTR